MYRWIVRSVIVGVIAAISACATTRIDLIQTQVVKVDRFDSDDAFVETVNVHQHQNEIELEVILRPNESVRRFVAGSVLVEIVPPGASQPTESFTLSRPEKSQYGMDSKLQHVHFHSRFPLDLKPGTIIRVSHIHGAEKEEAGHHNGALGKSAN